MPAGSDHTRTQMVETCLEKFGYLAFRRINSLSSFKKRNATVASKDTRKF